MKKKGKYKLLSYYVEKDLLFYSSLNKIKKIVGFCVIETKNILKIIEILNEFWIKSPLNSCAIQINVGYESNINLILNFENFEKKAIIQTFSNICNKFEKTGITFSVKVNNQLEQEFLYNIFNKDTLDLQNTMLQTSGDDLIIRDEKESIFYTFYHVNLNLLDDKRNFIDNFIGFMKDKGVNGHLILSHATNRLGDLQVSTYFVEIMSEAKSEIDIVKETNEFFKIELIKQLKPNLESIFKYLWRLPLTSSNYLVNNIDELYSLEEKYDFQNIEKLMIQIEHQLLEHKVDYQILNDNTILINNKIIFSILSTPDLDSIIEMVKNNIDIYQVYILVVNNEVYLNITKIEYVSEIENLKILNSEAFINLNFEDFKR